MKKIEYTARDGKTIITLVIREHLNKAIVESQINGKYSGSTDLPSPVPKGAPAGTVAAVGGVGLTAERLAEVMAELDALNAEISARPEVQMQRLIDQRTRLAEEIGYILDAAHEAYVNRIERASETGVMRKGGHDYDADEAAARKALAEFDEAHPEVLAKIKADKQADIELNMWN